MPLQTETYLHAANQGVINLITKKQMPSVISATPVPDVISVAFLLAQVKSVGDQSPHDYVEDDNVGDQNFEPPSSLWRPAMSNLPAYMQDDSQWDQRSNNSGKETCLRPSVGVGWPWREVSLGRKSLSPVKNVKADCRGGEDDQAATKADGLADRYCAEDTKPDLFAMIISILVSRFDYQMLCAFPSFYFCRMKLCRGLGIHHGNFTN